MNDFMRYPFGTISKSFYSGLPFGLFMSFPPPSCLIHIKDQSNRVDGGVALSKFSIRLCPRFSKFFSIVQRTLQKSSPLNTAPPLDDKQKNHFYAFINSDFEEINQRFVAELGERWIGKQKVDRSIICGSIMLVIAFYYFFFTFFHFLKKN